jgi:hypothetical protein
MPDAAALGFIALKQGFEILNDLGVVGVEVGLFG